MTDFFKPAPEPATELGRYHVLSPTAGVRVSPLCLGAMSIGDAWSQVMGSMSKESSFALLDAFFEAGGNFIDTANNYQNEQSEMWIGEWMQERGNRDRIVIATKFTSDFQGHKLGKGQAINFAGNSKKSLHVSLKESLRKLQTDYVDILYLHWWEYTTSIEEVMDSLDAIVKSGKVLYLGISDTPAWIVAAANTYARAHGKSQFVIYQGAWNVMSRDFERDILPMAAHFGMALAPWDVLGSGKFQTKKQLEARKAAGEGLRSMMGSEQSEAQAKTSEALAKVAEEHGIESVTAVALAYVMAKAPYVYPIVGGRKVEHLKDNIQGLSLRLTPQQIEYLESQSEYHAGFPYWMIGEDPHKTGKTQMILAGTGNFSWNQSVKPFTAA